jgi:DNA-binding transcriptional ArsR family regulator
LRPYQDITDPDLAKALAHPLRTRILGALDGRTASPSELAADLEAPLGVVSYHVRRLVALGFLKLVKRVPRRGAVEHYYTATTRPRITDEIWWMTPGVVKDATVAAALHQISDQINQAAATGGFDAREAHLARSPVTVDRKGWLALARELEAMTKRIHKIELESARRLQRAAGEGTLDASVVMMLFTSPTAIPADPPPGATRARSRRHTGANGRAPAGAN